MSEFVTRLFLSAFTKAPVMPCCCPLFHGGYVDLVKALPYVACNVDIFVWLWMAIPHNIPLLKLRGTSSALILIDENKNKSTIKFEMWG